MYGLTFSARGELRLAHRGLARGYAHRGQHDEVFLLQRFAQARFEQRRLARARRREEKDDALGDEEVDELGDFAIAAPETFVVGERARAT